MAQRNEGPVRACLEEGLRAQAAGRLDLARDAYSRALGLVPDHPDALQLLGTVWLQLGDAKEAATYLERAAGQLRNQPGVIGNLAHAYFSLGRYDEARESYRKASRLDPRNVYFQMGIAGCLGMQGKLADAETALRKLADRFPDEALLWLNLGNAVRDQERADEAMDLYRRALQVDSHLVDARNNLASLLHTRKRFVEAEREYRACVALAPDYVLAQYNLASVVIDLGRFREAEAICRDLIARHPQIPHAHTFLGAALGHQGRLREALDCHRLAAELAPHDAKIVETYASALAEAGDFGLATRWFARALSVNPESVPAHQLLGNALLSQGSLRDGWIEYGFRPAFSQFRHVHPAVPISRALPEELAGREVSVLREQGLGDELFFLRFAQPLSAAGARITYYASNKLHSLLGRVDCLERVLDESAPLPQGGTVILAGDLPHAVSACPVCSVGNSPDATEDHAQPVLPRRVSVFWPLVPPSLRIAPLTEQLAALKNRLALAGEPPYLGLTWRGGIPPSEQAGAGWSLYKEVGLESFAHALRDLRVTLIALQRKPGPDELETFSRAAGRTVHDFSDLNEDLEAMLAMLALADDYIGVSNTNMHLRAAVERTARVLVPCPAEWRWMATGSSSPWFPGFPIYRQSRDGDWGAALHRLHDDLQAAYAEPVRKMPLG